MLQRGQEYDNDGWRVFLDTATANWPTLASGQNLLGFVSGVPNIKTSAATYELVTPTGTQTLTGKTIALGSNTVSGTTAQFNTALTDGDFATLAGTETLTNKRITPRIFTLTDAATIAVSADTTDIGVVTLGGNRTLGNPSGTPTDGQTLMIRVRQDATGTRTLAYDTKYRFSAATAPTVTSTAAETSYLLFMYHSADDKWDCILTSLDFRA